MPAGQEVGAPGEGQHFVLLDLHPLRRLLDADEAFEVWRSGHVLGPEALRRARPQQPQALPQRAGQQAISEAEEQAAIDSR